MTKAKRLPKKQYEYFYSKVPRLAVDLVIQSSDGIVLSKRDIPPAKGKWHLSGGSMLFGENIYQTIDRIAKEETGLSVTMDKLLGIIEYSNKNAIGQSIALVYLVHPKKGTLTGSWQAEKIIYFTTLPKNTIKELGKFLVENKLISR